MEKQIDIIGFSISRADAPISSPGFSLAKEFAKSHRVFYIEHPHSWKDLLVEWNTNAIKKRRRSWFENEPPYHADQSGVTIVTSPLTMPINFLPDGAVYDLFSKKNDKIIFNLIRRLIKDYKISNYLFINFFDPFFCRQFPTDIRPWKTVYQSMDAIAEVKYTARHGVRLEDEMIRNADVTICTSSGLVELHGAKSKRVYLLPNGVDESVFLSTGSSVPDDIVNLDKPLIGYVGSIEYRMDFDLLLSVVRSLPSHEFLFIGPTVGTSTAREELGSCPNVQFLGPKPFEKIAAYLQCCDALIIPFKCDKLTSMIYPLKLNEYLMAGKPVIATDFSKDVSSFRPYVYIARNASDFSRLILESIAEDDPSKIAGRIQRARQNTWTARAARFFEILSTERAY